MAQSGGPGMSALMPQLGAKKREHVSDIDTVVADSLKVLDLKRPIREADVSAEVLVDVRQLGIDDVFPAAGFHLVSEAELDGVAGRMIKRPGPDRDFHHR